MDLICNLQIEGLPSTFSLKEAKKLQKYLKKAKQAIKKMTLISGPKGIHGNKIFDIESSFISFK